jgi:hypothetical protein
MKNNKYERDRQYAYEWEKSSRDEKASFDSTSFWAQ